ncbi:MAG: cold shock domain-containing protein [Actinobacteria bacterium]|nr:cold shock domain-containing protein [Actinomycetota bacterium]
MNRSEDGKGVDFMAQGRVDWYSANLGHGFILSEDGATKAFVRRKDIVTGEEENLENNDKVSYEVIQGTEGPEARNVSRI